jgi:hypothetical protein
MTDVEEMGPIDYVVVEWPSRQPHGEAMPHLIELCDTGVIRLLDLVFMQKDDSGAITILEVSDLDDEFAEFEGARSGLLDDDDIDEAAKVLQPGTSAALLMWENRWAAPFATALRRNGAQLVASGRVPVQALLASAGVTT